MPYCPYCGTEVDVHAAACPECGHPHPGGAPPVPQAAPQTDGFAIASLVAGIAGFAIWILGGVAAIVFGIVARTRIRDDPSRQGSGLATAGIVLGGVSLLFSALFIALAVTAVTRFDDLIERVPDREAQSALRNALTAAKTIYTDHETYRDATAATLGSAEPSLTFVEDANSLGPTFISFTVVSDGEFRAAAWSPFSATCFGIRDIARPGGGTLFASKRTSNCRATTFTDVEYGPSW